MGNLRQINSAILDAFDQGSLERLIRFGFGIDLDRIAGGGDRTELVFNLTRWAEENGHLDRLLELAKAESTNPRIQVLTVPNEQPGLDDGIEVDIKITNLRIEQLSKEVKSLDARVTVEMQSIKDALNGPHGDDGIRFVTKEHQRKIDEMQAALARLELSIRNPSKLFESASNRMFFYALMAVLLATFFLVVLSTFNYI